MSKHHCYNLVLTNSERRAIDFVGDRYCHGYDLFKILLNAEWKRVELGNPSTVPDNAIDGYKEIQDDDISWSGDYDIMFQLKEYLAWEIKCIIDSEIKVNKRLALFSESLQCKLLEFCKRIV